MSTWFDLIDDLARYHPGPYEMKISIKAVLDGYRVRGKYINMRLDGLIPHLQRITDAVSKMVKE